MISPGELNLFHYASTPEEAWEKLLIAGICGGPVADAK